MEGSDAEAVRDRGVVESELRVVEMVRGLLRADGFAPSMHLVDALLDEWSALPE